MRIDHFRQFAAYNHWPHRRLYATALAMPREAYRRPTGVFFGGLRDSSTELKARRTKFRSNLRGARGPYERRDRRQLSFPFLKDEDS